MYLIIILLIYLSMTVFEYWLNYLNLLNLRKYGSVIPAEFEGQIDQDLLYKTQNYNIEKMRFGFVSSVFHTIILILFLFGGIMDFYNSWIVYLNLPFIISGLIFFIILLYAETLLSIPFNLYSVFKIENKYGFNTMTPGLWFKDLIKSLLISTVLLGLVSTAGLFLIEKYPGLWWFLIWCFFLAFSVFMMYISPYIIEPLFHKFTSIGDEALEGSIRAIMQKAGIKVSRVFKIDASKRTRHTNAYFTGIGKVKRIILYDTLIEKMIRDELLSVLAHEAGHWKKRHILKFMIITECIALIVMYISFRILNTDILNDLFKIKEGTFFSDAVILGFLLTIAAFPFSPVFKYISRRNEIEADKYSYMLTGNAHGMINALVKLSRDNLSNLHPHPLYAMFHYTHPPVLERIRRIKKITEKH